MMNEKPHVDDVGNLEAALFESLAELRLEAQHVALLTRICQVQALALADSRGRETEKLLASLIAAEHSTRRPRRKTKATMEHDGPRRR